MDSHFQKLINMYQKAPIQQLYPETVMEIKETGHAEITMPVDSSHFHAAGALHGSVYFRLLDDSSFFAANSMVQDVFVLTAQYNTQFLRPCSGGELKAVGNVVSMSRQSIVAESILYDSKQRIIGKGSGIFLKSSIPLNSEIGY